MGKQVETRCLEFLPDQPQPQEPCAEGIFLICGLRPYIAGASLCQGLVADGKAQLYVGFYFPRMGRAVV